MCRFKKFPELLITHRPGHSFCGVLIWLVLLKMLVRYISSPLNFAKLLPSALPRLTSFGTISRAWALSHNFQFAVKVATRISSRAGGAFCLPLSLSIYLCLSLLQTLSLLECAADKVTVALTPGQRCNLARMRTIGTRLESSLQRLDELLPLFDVIWGWAAFRLASYDPHKCICVFVSLFTRTYPGYSRVNGGKIFPHISTTCVEPVSE